MLDPVWDVELGVWKGEMAASLDVILPTPLYIFGYGSLIWNPGPYLKNFDSFHCSAIGWKRLFAQRSSDHRGTVLFPGLVLNLVDDCCLKDLNYIDETTQSECIGMIWHVPVAVVTEVVADLDYRERGGYCRQIVRVKLQENTPFHKRDDIVDALVYTGPRYNPNFYLPARSCTDHVANSDVFGLATRNAVMDIIAAAIGPSGANVDYLFNLERYLHERGLEDSYLVELADGVRRRVGPWLGRRHRQHLHTSPQSNREGASFVLSGWGANEFLQLRPDLGGDDEYLSDLHAHHFWATRLPLMNSAAPTKDTCTMNSHVSAGGGTSAVIHSDGTLLLWGKLLPFVLQHVVRDTVFVQHGDAVTQGTSHIRITGVDAVSIAHDHCLLLLRSGHVAGFGSNSHGQLTGPESLHPQTDKNDFFVRRSNVLLELVDGADQNEPSYRIQSRSSAQSDSICAGLAPEVSVLKVAAGLRHSAAITSDGRLITWGDALHGQCLQPREDANRAEEQASWFPPIEASRLIDVACGARFTLAVDSEGHIYSLGSDKHGCLSRKIGDNNTAVGHGRSLETKSAVPGEVEGLPEGVRWQRVVCGWSHVVARGIRPDGQLVFWTWGRCDMGQCLSVAPSVEGKSDREDGRAPRQVRPLPGNRNIAEVWAGSEYTVVCDDEGSLWGCGWNEHGNLGNGDVHCKNALEEWQPALERSREGGNPRHVRLAAVWEGAAACGGGHTLCIEQFQNEDFKLDM